MRLLNAFLVFATGLTLAQSQPVDLETLWREVAEAEKKGLPKTAAVKLQLIYDSARRDGKQAEAIKALAKRITHDGAVQGNKPEEKITRLRAELDKTPAEAKPLLIVHSETDRSAPVGQAEGMADALVQAGAPFEFLHFPGRGHMSVTDEVVDASTAFIDTVCADRPLRGCRVEVE